MQREMDEPSWPIQDTQWMDCFLGSDPLKLYKEKGKALVSSYEGTIKHKDWAYGQE